jgi:large subunit ribosomal protein L29
MEMAEIRNLGPDELHDKLGQLKKTLMQYRFQAKTGKLERQSVIGETKRDIARILTALNAQRHQASEAKKS